MKESVLRPGARAALLAFLFDQATKALAITAAPLLSEGIDVLPGFSLVLVRNTGISFGMFGAVPWWLLALGGTGISAGLGVWLWREDDRLTGTALGLVIGGAMGNVVDRVRYGGVTDFIDLHAGSYHWPAFNLADVAIFGGAALLAARSFRTGH